MLIGAIAGMARSEIQRISPPSLMEKLVLTDVKTLRKQARQDLTEGAGTASYTADREAVLKLLNVAFATEIVCTLR